jgi:hypothetical protein
MTGLLPSVFSKATATSLHHVPDSRATAALGPRIQSRACSPLSVG